MTLNDWQSRFESHFSQLRDNRRNASSRPVVYALEHGLAESEVAGFIHDVRQTVRPGHRPAQGHRLVWTVYAAEVGYGYSGEEYWATFTSQTDNWEDSNLNREYIRSAFKDFQTLYDGATPRGRWAEHFSIICWPITHAILPQDLQRELAHSLYRIRYDFDTTLLADPRRLGSAISEDAELVASSRFRQFAEDQLLVGQIAASLLLEETEFSKSHIAPETLIRITTDLAKSRRSLEWLRDARQKASKVRSQARVFHGSRNVSGQVSTNGNHANPTVSYKLLRPTLSLRQVTTDSWSVYLRLPDGQELIRKMPDVREALQNCGCFVAGTQGRRLARGRFMHRGQDVGLTSWPEPEELLFHFEGVAEETNYRIAAAGCMLPARRQWLFKILGDGTADEIVTHTVRPGESYVLIRTADTSLELPKGAVPVLLNCNGVVGHQLDIPDVVPSVDQEAIHRAELTLLQGLWARPVGSLSAYSSSEFEFTWCLPNRPMIHVGSDFEVNAADLKLSNTSGEVISRCTVTTLPAIIDLGPLEAGHFYVGIQASKSGSSQTITEQFSVEIRSPGMEERMASIAAPFVMDLSPAKPSFEDFWGGKASINIYAPRGTSAEFTFRMATGDRWRPSMHPRKMTLPCDERQWGQFLKSVSQEKSFRNALDAATRCLVEIDCGPLGHSVLHMDRRPSPIRWVSREQNSGCLLRLEELDQQRAVTCKTYSFARPMDSISFVGDPRIEFREPDANLYLAETSSHIRETIIAAGPVRAFSALREKPYIPALSRTEENVWKLLTSYHLWYSARIVGDASAYDRREHIVTEIRKEIIRQFCGDSWAQMEQTYRGRPGALSLQNSISTNPTLSPAIALIAQGVTNSPGRTAERVIESISDLSQTYDVVSGNHDDHFSHALVDFAYQMLNQPYSLKPEDGRGERMVIRSLLQNPVLCRMVRFSYLMTESS